MWNYKVLESKTFNFCRKTLEIGKPNKSVSQRSKLRLREAM